jgi:CHASE3 domain sensor protein
MIADTVESLKFELQKSDKKLNELRNLYEDIESKLIVERSFNRYIRSKLKSIQNVLPNTQGVVSHESVTK